MATCKNCRKSGLFTKVNGLGVCDRCNSIINIETPPHFRIYKDCCSIIETTENPETLKNRLDLLKKQLEYFHTYESKGINLLTPSPSALFQTLESERDSYYIECFEKAFKTLAVKVTELKTKSSQVNRIEKFIQLIDEYKSELIDSSSLSGMRSRAQKLFDLYSA